MAKSVEQTMKPCKACDKQTLHAKNTTKSGWLAILINIILIIGTLGGWILVILLYRLLHMRIGGKGGWICQDCGK